MKKTLIALIAVAALAAPTAAFANDGHGKSGKHSRHHGHGLYAKLTGTATTFGGGTATASGTIVKGSLLDSGTFSATVNTTWSSATTKTSRKGTLSCAPATATLSVVGAVTTNTVGSTLTGKTCAFTKTDGTVVRAFFGKGSADGNGLLAALDGNGARLYLLQQADGSVKGAVWAGSRGEDRNSLFVLGEREAKHKTGDCDR
jgi:hypothetical protein